MNTVIGIIIGLLVLMGLIVAHELGHFIAARRNGVKVLEFGIGFPPKFAAWIINPEYEKWKKSGKPAQKKPKKWLKLARSEWNKPQKTLIFSLNCLPIGGFCSMDGESDSDTKKGTFGAASFWGKTKILFAGVAMNWLVAFVILTILAITGMPHFVENQFTISNDTEVIPGIVTVNSIIEDSPAERAKFSVGDQILKLTTADSSGDNSSGDAETVETVDVVSASDIINFNTDHAGEKITYLIIPGDDSSSSDSERCKNYNNSENTCELTAILNGSDAEYSLGITMSQSNQTLYRSTWSAPIVGAATTIQLTGETYKGLWGMIWNFCSGLVKQFSSDTATREEGTAALQTAGDSVSGPVGIIGVIFPAFTEAGATNLAFLAALISVSLACMNVLPIPALDGGRWLLIAIFRLRGKKLEKATEEKIVSRAFMILLILIALITILDVTRLF